MALRKEALYSPYYYLHIQNICSNAVTEFNCALLNSSLGALSHFLTVGYTRAALESISNQKSVQENGSFKEFGAPSLEDS